MSLQFAIANWRAWAPGLQDEQAWQDWARAPHAIDDDGKPAVKAMPAMARRRLDRLGRMALEVGYAVRGDVVNSPIVAASRHGSANRALKLLHQLTADGTVSPSAFSVSVHNAIVGAFAVARGDTAPYSAVAAGPQTPEMAIVEACGYLHDGADSVLVLLYDEPMPGLYQDFANEDMAPFAVAMELTRDTGLRLRLQAGEGAKPGPGQLPRGLDLLQFLYQERDCLDVAGSNWHWQWRRGHA